MMWTCMLIGCLAGWLLSLMTDWLTARRAGQPAGGDGWRARMRLGPPARQQTFILATTGGLLFGYLWVHVGPSPRLAILMSYIWVLLLILVIDLKQRLIYNAVLLPAAVGALVASLLAPPPSLLSALAGGVAGFGTLGAVALAYPRSMGAGDVKLAGLIGLMAGFPQVLVALALGVLAGGGVALALLAVRLVGRKSYIPYAPFLALGAMVTLIHGQEILVWYLSRLGG